MRCHSTDTAHNHLRSCAEERTYRLSSQSDYQNIIPHQTLALLHVPSRAYEYISLLLSAQMSKQRQSESKPSTVQLYALYLQDTWGRGVSRDSQSQLELRALCISQTGESKQRQSVTTGTACSLYLSDRRVNRAQCNSETVSHNLNCVLSVSLRQESKPSTVQLYALYLQDTWGRGVSRDSQSQLELRYLGEGSKQRQSVTTGTACSLYLSDRRVNRAQCNCTLYTYRIPGGGVSRDRYLGGGGRDSQSQLNCVLSVSLRQESKPSTVQLYALYLQDTWGSKQRQSVTTELRALCILRQESKPSTVQLYALYLQDTWEGVSRDSQYNWNCVLSVSLDRRVNRAQCNCTLYTYRIPGGGE
ncbi:hypothetical protein J6590_046517 [Homalodisca vitripennis]|nr:hypothetical protein J6590_046517 [Homalodisca vitripennis]